MTLGLGNKETSWILLVRGNSLLLQLRRPYSIRPTLLSIKGDWPEKKKLSPLGLKTIQEGPQFLPQYSTNLALCLTLIHCLQNPHDGKGMNIDKVWQQGVTGKGIVVAVVDDGLQQSHPDLKDNYVSKVQVIFSFFSLHG